MGERGRAACFVLATLVLGACAHAHGGAAKDAAAGAKAAEKGQVVVSADAFEGGELALAAWLAYGSAKAALYDKPRPTTANDSADDFDLELGAREAQSKFWEEETKKKGATRPKDPDLDRQVEVWRAGFLPELVVAIHAKPGWTIPANVIEGLRFDQFGERFSGDYHSGAPVAVGGVGGRLYPVEPGADFPDPATLPYGPESCGRARDERRAAWARWATIEPRLGGAPVSAASTVELSRELVAIKRDKQRMARGATWVSERVGHLAMVDGFCAVDAEDWKRAGEVLTRAVSLQPSNPAPRLELSMALLHLGKVSEALAEADTIIATSDDACAVAPAWRRRGYILIEVADLKAAKAAYEKSLEIEPGNPIALQELRVIAEGLSNSKKKGTEGARGFVPPPPLGMKVTTCKRAGAGK